MAVYCAAVASAAGHHGNALRSGSSRKTFPATFDRVGFFVPFVLMSNFSARCRGIDELCPYRLLHTTAPALCSLCSYVKYPRRQNPRKKLTDNSVADGKNQRPITPRAEGELTPNNSQYLSIPPILLPSFPCRPTQQFATFSPEIFAAFAIFPYLCHKITTTDEEQGLGRPLGAGIDTET